MNIFSEIIKLPNYINNDYKITQPSYGILNNDTPAPQIQKTSNFIKIDNLALDEPFNKAELQKINLPPEATKTVTDSLPPSQINTTNTTNTSNISNTNNNFETNNTYTTSNNFATNNSYTTSNNFNTSNVSNTSNISNISNVSNFIRDDITLSKNIRAIDTNLSEFQQKTSENINKINSNIELSLITNSKSYANIAQTQNALFEKIDDFKNQSLDLVQQNLALKRQNQQNTNYNTGYTNVSQISNKSEDSNNGMAFLFMIPLVFLLK